MTTEPFFPVFVTILSWHRLIIATCLENKQKQNPPSLSLYHPTALPPALSSNFSSLAGFLHLEMSVSCWSVPPFVLKSSFISQNCAVFFTSVHWVRKILVLLWCIGTEQTAAMAAQPMTKSWFPDRFLFVHKDKNEHEPCFVHCLLYSFLQSLPVGSLEKKD